MQRLKRLRDDRGAAAVWLAILLVPLVIVAALAIDVAAAHADRQRLQTGADAAALAVAQECARGECDTATETATELATANAPMGGAVTATVTRLDPERGIVEVETTSDRDHWFASVIGEDDVSLGASSVAVWGAPTSVRGHLPLAFSWCEIAAQTGADPITDASGAVIGLDIRTSSGSVTMHNTGGPDHGCRPRTGHNEIPGGFGWLDPGPSCLETATSVGQLAGSEPGNNPSKGCTPQHFASLVGETGLLPVYDRTEGQGQHATYHIIGYVAFTIESYFFGSDFKPAVGAAPCRGSDRCIRGVIERFVELGAAAELGPGGAQLGADVVRLRLQGEE